MRTILHALSYGNIEVEASRKLADLKKLDVMRIFWKKLDKAIREVTEGYTLEDLVNWRAQAGNNYII